VVAALVLQNTKFESYEVVVFASGTKYSTHKVCTFTKQKDEDNEKYCWDVCEGHAEAICYHVAGVYFLHEISKAQMTPSASRIFQYNESECGYELIDTVKFHLFISKSPCGFMSNSVLHAVSWKDPFEEAPHVLSCSSKILVGSYLGIQSFTSCYLVKPIYVSSIVILHEHKTKLPGDAAINYQFDQLKQKIVNLTHVPDTDVQDESLVQTRLSNILDSYVPQKSKILHNAIMKKYKTVLSLDFMQNLEKILNEYQHLGDHLYDKILQSYKQILMFTPGPEFKQKFEKSIKRLLPQNKLYIAVKAAYDSMENPDFRVQLQELLQRYEKNYNKQQHFYTQIKEAYEDSLEETTYLVTTEFSEKVKKLLQKHEKQSLYSDIMKAYNDFPMISSYQHFIESIPQDNKQFYDTVIERFLEVLYEKQDKKFIRTVQELFHFESQICKNIVKICVDVQKEVVDQKYEDIKDKVKCFMQCDDDAIKNVMKLKPEITKDNELLQDFCTKIINIYLESICPKPIKFEKEVEKLVNPQTSLFTDIMHYYEVSQKVSIHARFMKEINDLFKHLLPKFCTDISNAYLKIQVSNLEVHIKEVLLQTVPIEDQWHDQCVKIIIKAFQDQWMVLNPKCVKDIQAVLGDVCNSVMFAYNEFQMPQLHVKVIELVKSSERWITLKFTSEQFNKVLKESEKACIEAIQIPSKDREFHEKIKQLLKNCIPHCFTSQQLYDESVKVYEAIVKHKPHKKLREELKELFDCCMQRSSNLYSKVAAAYHETLVENIRDQVEVDDLSASYVKPSVHFVESSQEIQDVFGQSITKTDSSRAQCCFMIPGLENSFTYFTVNDNASAVQFLWKKMPKKITECMDLIKKAPNSQSMLDTHKKGLIF